LQKPKLKLWQGLISRRNWDLFDPSEAYRKKTFWHLGAKGAVKWYRGGTARGEYQLERIRQSRGTQKRIYFTLGALIIYRLGLTSLARNRPLGFLKKASRATVRRP